MSTIHYVQCNFNVATIFARDAIKEQPRSLHWREKLVSSLRALGKREEAIQISHETLKLDSSQVWAHVHLAVLYAEKKEFSLALNHISQALVLQPSNISLREKELSFLRGMGKKDEAEHLAREILNRDPTQAWAHVQLSILCAERHQLDVAMDHIREALKLQPSNVHWRDKEVSFLRGMNKKEEAEQLAREILERDPSQGWAYAQLAALSIERKDHEQAEHYMRHALSIDPLNVHWQKKLLSIQDERARHTSK